MIRNRNVFIEDFFGADGASIVGASTGGVKPLTSPTTRPTTSPALAEISPATPSLSDPKSPAPVIPRYVPTPSIYPVIYPTPVSPLVMIQEPVYVIPDESAVTMSPTISNGGGGGFGNGSMLEEETGKTEEGAREMPEDNSGKKKIIALILLAVVLYVAYRYWKKTK